ncbi:hypothetical protein OAO68_02460 [Alphaproteobacteria bacterium]|nr:hypothetical protein [Alphaproteobacteria bacterium]
MFIFSRHITKIIIMLLFVVTYLILPNLPSEEELSRAGNFFIIFAAFLPSLWLLRATAITMPSVKKTQKLLSELISTKILSGLQVTSHILGGVLNIGTFPLLSSVIPQNAKDEIRQAAGEAAIRGMNTAVLWSPFFVSFAVGQLYLPSNSAWLGIAFGLLVALLFNIISMRFLIGKLTLGYLLETISCVKPILSRLLILSGSVLFVGQIFNKTALNAIVIVIPILVIFQMMRRPETTQFIIQNLTRLIKNSGDEMLLISVSMFLGSILSGSTEIQNFISLNIGENFPFWVMIILLPFVVWFFALLGVHPIITSAPILSLFGPLLSVWEAAFLMQAHLIGWCAGTASSFTSLSVLTTAENFKISIKKLIIGPNLIATGCLTLFGSILLILLNYFL